MSGWTNVTCEPADELPPVASSRPERDPATAVENYLEAQWTEESSECRMIPRSPPTMQIWRESRESKLREVATDLFEGCDAIERVLVIYANDTSNSGQGWLFERPVEDTYADQAQLVDHISGYEGARGKDAVGQFRDEYDISGTASAWV